MNLPAGEGKPERCGGNPEASPGGTPPLPVDPTDPTTIVTFSPGNIARQNSMSLGNE